MRRTIVVLAALGLIATGSVAVATHGFTDVPTDHVFHDNIQWMKDNGITFGCNPPENTEYCPDDNVTRGQMAAFMERFAQSGVVGGEGEGPQGPEGPAGPQGEPGDDGVSQAFSLSHMTPDQSEIPMTGDQVAVAEIPVQAGEVVVLNMTGTFADGPTGGHFLHFGGCELKVGDKLLDRANTGSTTSSPAAVALTGLVDNSSGDAAVTATVECAAIGDGDDALINDLSVTGIVAQEAISRGTIGLGAPTS